MKTRMKIRTYELTLKGLQSLQASVRIRQPWTKATGPKTPLGKKMSSLNALKTGSRSRLFGAKRHSIPGIGNDSP